MLKWVSLRAKIFLPVAALTALTLGGGLISMWYFYQTGTFFRVVVDENLSAVKSADRLEYALVMQKGFLTYFFQDGDEAWLQQMRRWREEFEAALKKARTWADTENSREILNNIESNSIRLNALKDQVVSLYKQGLKEEGFRVHRTARRGFEEILRLSEEFRRDRENRIAEARRDVDERARRVTRMALTAMAVTILLGAFLAWVLVFQVLSPIHRLALEAARRHDPSRHPDEVLALSRGVHSLMEDVDQAKSELEVSRSRLLQASKMASVGKLASSVAHSIRNPLTSVKMRLFSLERSLLLNDNQKEDFKVIGEEIRHIDNVLRNFLEFSRRPKLTVQRISPSEVVDMALDLMAPRMNSTNTEIILKRQAALPEIEVDPAQLREALVNLLVNAGEAMGRDGRITIEESLENTGPFGPAAVIRIQDAGPGVPEVIQDQVFQLFFSTKDEGTGLGLSIASRIVEEHGGGMVLESPPTGGAAFIIRLPIKEVRSWEKY
ncbi:MAG: ATP-binding protein [Pseudomonadota bacterium]